MTGADLLIAWCDLPPLAMLIASDQAIAAVPDSALAAVYQEWQGEDPPDADDWRPGTRDLLRDALENLVGGRLCAIVNIHGHEVVIGGGTSWGDAPDGYLDVVYVALSGIGQSPD